MIRILAAKMQRQGTKDYGPSVQNAIEITERIRANYVRC